MVTLTKRYEFLRFQVLKAASMKMTVFWDVVPCVLAASIIRALTMEAISTSVTSVNFYQTTRRNIPEDSHLHLVIAFFRKV
jgi:hypothetical protein